MGSHTEMGRRKIARSRTDRDQKNSESPKLLPKSGGNYSQREWANHVLYAKKYYTKKNEICLLQLFLQPMSEVEFHEQVAEYNQNILVYALHQH